MPLAAHRRGRAPPAPDPPRARRARADALRRRRRTRASTTRARRTRSSSPARRAVPLSPSWRLGLSTRCPLEIVDGGDARRASRLRAGETRDVRARRVEPGEHAGAVLRRRDRRRVRRDRRVLAALAAPLALPRALARDGAPLGADAQAAHLAPTGAIVAAPTTSLPEQLGGARNWDYRYTWIRDAAFSLYALLRLGFTEEAGAFMEWLSERFATAADRRVGPLQIMYGIDGREELPEEELPHLEGYRGLGAGADRQRRRDPAPARHLRRADRLGLPLQQVRRADLPRRLDRAHSRSSSGCASTGTSPTRASGRPAAGASNFTYSRLMCWVAIERAIRIARQRGLPGRHRALDARPATSIYHQIMAARLAPRARRAFVQHYDSDVLDASLLLMPLVQVHRARPTRAGSRRSTRSPTSWSPTPWSTATTSTPRPTGSRRGGHVLDVLVLVRRGAGPGRAARRGAARLREDAHLRQPPRACTRRRSGRPASSSATSPRPSRTWR